MQSSCLSLLSLSLSQPLSHFFLFSFFFSSLQLVCALRRFYRALSIEKSPFSFLDTVTLLLLLFLVSRVHFFVVIRLIIIIFFVLFFSPDSTECVQETSNSHKEKEGRSTRGNLKSLPLLEETDVHTHTKKPSKAVFKV